jgi:nitric oxide reductase NorD protein
MDRGECKKRFYELVFPSLPNEWEIDPIIDQVAELSAHHQQQLLSQITAIWPVSHSLGLSFLEDGCRVIDAVPAELIPKWVRTILRSYEQEGLTGARRYILQAREFFLEPLERRNTVSFEEVVKQMLFYLRGISGEELHLEKNTFARTDTTTYYLPPAISLLSNYDDNRFLYKFLLSLHWGFYRWGTFRLRAADWKEITLTTVDDEDRSYVAGHRSMQAQFSAFDDPQLAKDIFFLLETERIIAALAAHLPGLVKKLGSLQDELIHVLSTESEQTPGARVSDLGFDILSASFTSPLGPAGQNRASDEVPRTADSVLAAVTSTYERIWISGQPYHRPPIMELLGKHDFERVELEIDRKRTETKHAFMIQLEALKSDIEKEDEHRGGSSSNRSVQTMVVATKHEAEDQLRSTLGILDNPEVEIPEDLVKLIEAILDDLGHIPQSYFSAASGVAGHGFSTLSLVDTAGIDSSVSQGEIQFDEWDYRRHGYRRNWCTIVERQLPELQSTFVNSTLEKHRGTLVKLRRQFEMMKTTEHFIRRQREGDDLDLDAIVEARGDKRAGISPSEKLFVRLQRNERDIATVFLVDMSNSTEGWVGTVIKEALVLLCEVMDVTGDPYAILGFSGMRRSRCDLYLIKSIDEPYTHMIRQRISSISPREYTRMGPAIRYAVNQLKQYEARSRLLVSITDGKPEDYDDYKGEYAIEDSRKALQEARGYGIHTFGITVDREAHDYLPQLFGNGNYIFIDDIDKLPMRMIDMYRLLTV